METIDLKDTYLKFFESKGHVIIPSAPIIPENDPTCLFNTAGMQFSLLLFLKISKYLLILYLLVQYHFP